MTIYKYTAATLAGEEVGLETWRGRVLLIVNTASECGFTPQYAGLEALYKKLKPEGLTILGFPCNQFGGQEPGGAEEIQAFCVATYATSFPLTEKLDVNGRRQHPLYAWLTSAPDGDGRAGEVEWNFEKFLVAPDRQGITRFRPAVEPDDERVVEAIEALLGE